MFASCTRRLLVQIEGNFLSHRTLIVRVPFAVLPPAIDFHRFYEVRGLLHAVIYRLRLVGLIFIFIFARTLIVFVFFVLLFVAVFLIIIVLVVATFFFLSDIFSVLNYSVR